MESIAEDYSEDDRCVLKNNESIYAIATVVNTCYNSKQLIMHQFKESTRMVYRNESPPLTFESFNEITDHVHSPYSEYPEEEKLLSKKEIINNLSTIKKKTRYTIKKSNEAIKQIERDIKSKEMLLSKTKNERLQKILYSLVNTYQEEIYYNFESLQNTDAPGNNIVYTSYSLISEVINEHLYFGKVKGDVQSNGNTHYLKVMDFRDIMLKTESIRSLFNNLKYDPMLQNMDSSKHCNEYRNSIKSSGKTKNVDGKTTIPDSLLHSTPLKQIENANEKLRQELKQKDRIIQYLAIRLKKVQDVKNSSIHSVTMQ